MTYITLSFFLVFRLKTPTKVSFFFCIEIELALSFQSPKTRLKTLHKQLNTKPNNSLHTQLKFNLKSLEVCSKLEFLIASMGEKDSETAPIWEKTRQRESSNNNNNIHPMDLESSSLSGQQRSLNRSRSSYEGRGRGVKEFRSWFSWLIPCFVVANVVVFVITMYVNNCPKKSGDCFADFLGRFSFQNTRENPLLGPTSLT